MRTSVEDRLDSEFSQLQINRLDFILAFTQKGKFWPKLEEY